MAIPDTSKAGSPFSPLQTGGWNPETPEINNFFIPLFSFRRGYPSGRGLSFGQSPDHLTWQLIKLTNWNLAQVQRDKSELWM